MCIHWNSQDSGEGTGSVAAWFIEDLLPHVSRRQSFGQKSFFRDFFRLFLSTNGPKWAQNASSIRGACLAEWGWSQKEWILASPFFQCMYICNTNAFFRDFCKKKMFKVWQRQWQRVPVLLNDPSGDFSGLLGWCSLRGTSKASLWRDRGQNYDDAWHRKSDYDGENIEHYAMTCWMTLIVSWPCYYPTNISCFRQLSTCRHLLMP